MGLVVAVVRVEQVPVFPDLVLEVDQAHFQFVELMTMEAVVEVVVVFRGVADMVWMVLEVRVCRHCEAGGVDLQTAFWSPTAGLLGRGQEWMGIMK